MEVASEGHKPEELRTRWVAFPTLNGCDSGDNRSGTIETLMAAYHTALHSQVDCIEIDVSRSSDGILFALHDRDLQQISGNSTSKVGHLSVKEIKELDHDQNIPTVEDALKLISSSVRQIILDAKVGPPSYEKGLAKDILSVLHSFVSSVVADAAPVPAEEAPEVMTEAAEATDAVPATEPVSEEKTPSEVAVEKSED
ncbi:hypothetical protein HYC85_016949 [Camellia sinensis]|uniref:glycerophosphodiester phosphodiesterase n=1 Tax=Camellia sinensis TaxID=4442 RepID=A0A7J7H395_CAMSI|nr:hypothetical protein HYC85_016949 [Camellia sinensis]